jgi:uncharacterized protein
MEMSYALIFTLVGWFLGGFINGIVGFGAALVAMPIVATGIDMHVAVPTCGLVILALNVQMAWTYRGHLDTTGIGPLFLGAAPGAAFGVLLLQHVPETWLKAILGGLLAAYALWGLANATPRTRRLAFGWGALTGFFSTSLGTSFGFNGPPLAVYLSLRGGSQQRIKAALGAFFIVSSIFIVMAHALAGFYTIMTVKLFAVALPAVCLGAWAGMVLSRVLKDFAFQRLLFVMILVMGLHMVWAALASP